MMQVFEALIGFRPGKGNYFSQYGIFQAVCVHLYLSFTQLEKKKSFFCSMSLFLFQLFVFICISLLRCILLSPSYTKLSLLFFLLTYLCFSY